ncbi:MAG: hypothetical protein RL609_1015 [Bacteroidota bacterium]
MKNKLRSKSQFLKPSLDFSVNSDLNQKIMSRNIIHSLVFLMCLAANTAWTQISDNFETDNGSWISFSGTEWALSTTGALSGTQSLRQNGSGTLTTTYRSTVSKAVPVALTNLNGVTTTWEFKISTYGKTLNSSSKFWVVLAANQADTKIATGSNQYEGTVGSKYQGYAIGINPNTALANTSAEPFNLNPTKRFLKLMKVTSGSTAMVSDLIEIPSTTGLYGGEWGQGPNSISTAVGIKVTRTPNGAWTVQADYDNNGVYEVTSSTVTDNTYTAMNYVGASVRWPNGTATPSAHINGNFAIDDFTVSQASSSATYYSIAAGNMSGANVWSLTSGGSAVTPTINSGTNLIIQHAVQVDGNYNVNNVTLETGGSLSANGASQTLTLAGNWTNNSSETAFNGLFGSSCCTSGCRVVMAGGSAQTIGGTAGTQFMELQINNSNGVTLNAPVYVSAAVIPTLGTLTTNGTGGSLNLMSTATCSGSIQSIGVGADVSGPVLLQRYIPSNPASNWMFLSCPLYSNNTNTMMTPNAAWGARVVKSISYPALAMTTTSIKFYNEALVGVSNVGFTAISPSTGTLNPLLGYNVYATASAKTVNPIGFPIKGSITRSLSYTPSGAAESWGRNLVGNPYPAEIDWMTVEASSSDVGAYYIYDYQSSNYLYFNANNSTYNTSTGYPDGIGRYIPHSQSFFVIATGAGQNLNFSENAKVNRCSPKGFERSENQSNSLIARLYDAANHASDVSTIVLEHGSSEKLDAGYDVYDLFDPTVNNGNLAFLSEEKYPLMSASIAEEHQQAVPVVLDLQGNGISQSRLVFEAIPDASHWYFIAEAAGLQVSTDGIAWSNLNPNEWVMITPEMNFRLTFNESFKGQMGQIISCPNGQCAPDQATVALADRLQILNGWNQITVRNSNNNIEQVVVRDAMGKEVARMNGSQTQWMIDTQSWAAGVYVVETQNDLGKTCVEKVMIQ